MIKHLLTNVENFSYWAVATRAAKRRGQSYNIIIISTSPFKTKKLHVWAHGDMAYWY